MKAVVYVASRNLYPYLKPSITSLVEHTPVDRIYLLIEDDEFPYALPKCAKVINISEQEWFCEKQPNWKMQFSYLCLQRVCYTKILPKNLTKVLQLDCDTIIMDDLSPLWDMDMGDNYAMAVEEYEGTFKPYGEHYFNSGVTMYNLKQLRKDKMDDRMIKMLQREEVPYIDQDALNKLCKDRIIPLPVRYNECFVTGRTEDPAVIHFAGLRNWWDTQADVPQWQKDKCRRDHHLIYHYGSYES